VRLKKVITLWSKSFSRESEARKNPYSTMKVVQRCFIMQLSFFALIRSRGFLGSYLSIEKAFAKIAKALKGVWITHLWG
jgi:hypothetical protein